MGISHISVNFRLWHKSCYRIDNYNIDGSGTHHGLGDLERLLSAVRLGNIEIVNINTYILRKKGSCRVFTAPFDVKLSDQPLTMVQPDIMIICDKDKLDQKRCNGAPDFIIEIVSPSTSSDDYIRKLYYYKTYGVREYWIVDPKRKLVTVNYIEGNLVSVQYSFDSVIKVNIYDDLFINFAEIAELSGI